MKKLLLITALVFSPSFACAESLTLEQVIKDSLQKNTSIYRVQREYEDKLASAIESEILDNPEFQVDADKKKGTSGTGYAAELTQPLKLSQLSGSRLGYADLLTQVADSEQKYEILKVINETTALYTQVWLLAERKKLYENYTEDAEKMKKLVSNSAKQGQTSPAAAHLFSADAAKLRADAGAVGAELQQVRSELARLTGQNYQAAEFGRPIFVSVPDSVEKLVSFAESRANLRNITQSRVQAAQQRLHIAQQDAILPEISPRLLYSRAGNGDEKSYGVGVALRIPLWNQNDGERKRAGAELRQAKSETDLFTGLPQKELLAQLQQSAAALQTRSDSYFKNILPSYRKSYALTRDMFRQGQVAALEVWQIREKLLASENEALDAVAQAVNARGVLELELGGKIEEIGKKASLVPNKNGE